MILGIAAVLNEKGIEPVKPVPAIGRRPIGGADRLTYSVKVAIPATFVCINRLKKGRT